MSPKKQDEKTIKVKEPLAVQIVNGGIKELEKGLTVVKGQVNGKEAWILRDTGCTTVCMSKDFAEKLNLNSKAERWITQANGSECVCHEIEIDLQSPYLSGKVMTLTMDCPFADITLGESAFMKVLDQIKSNDEKLVNKTDECKVPSDSERMKC